MNIVKCANGHFFDSETYKLCPHCGAPIGAASQTPAAPAAPPKKEKKGLFGGFHGKKEKTGKTIQPDWGGAQGGYSQGQGYQTGGYQGTYESYNGGNMNYVPPVSQPGPRTEDVPIDFTPKQPIPNDGKTLDFWKTTSGSNLKEAEPMPAAPAEPEPSYQPDPAVSVPIQEPVPVTPAAPEPVKEEQKLVNSLLNEVRQASASDEGKTLSYFSAVTGAAAAAPAASAAPGAPAQPAAPKAIDPVVGWLVSIEGPHFGESFGIHSGTNSIGRSAGNRIVLASDMAVSREKHAFITYEPKHRRFYVKPGDSSGLIYVNEEYITENKQIAPRDVLEIGSSKLIFVPFCTEEFGWEDVLNK